MQADVAAEKRQVAMPNVVGHDGTDARADSHATQGFIRLDLIEGFRLSVHDRPVPLPLASQRVLAFIAIHDRPVLRAYIAGNLWIDKSEERASANLRSALWRLRQPGLTLVEGKASQLSLARQVSVDIVEATALARSLVSGQDVTLDRNRPDSLLGGDLLPDWYDEWVLTERERLRQMRLHALEALCELQIDGNHFAEAVDTALCATAADPFRESTHRLLIRSHLAQGNRVQAMRHYNDYVDRLDREMGIAPSPAFTSLMEGLRSSTR